MSLSSYCIARAGGDERYAGLPVFLSRSFRHASVYVHDGAGVRQPRDLEGRRVGVPEYQVTAAVWARGMLQHDHDVDLDAITWVTGGLEQPGRVERQPLKLPPRVRIDPLPDGDTLSSALLRGDIDALIAPRVPSAFRPGHTDVRRLFPDYAAREVDYYRRTGLFPIMHLVVVRASLLAERPWVAGSLVKAFRAAKEQALAGLLEAPALRYTMPLLLDALERQREVFGEDPWPYGLEANRAALVEFAAYLEEQGLLERRPTPEELFAPSTIVEHRV